MKRPAEWLTQIHDTYLTPSVLSGRVLWRKVLPAQHLQERHILDAPSGF
jgi:hypothetical protein